MNGIALKVALGLLGASLVGLSIADDSALAQSKAKSQFPAARFPKMVNAKSVAEALPMARAWARNKSSFLGRGLGEAKAGEKVIIVTTATEPAADPYVQAIVQALKERQVTTILMHDYMIAGVSLDDARALERFMSVRLQQTSREGWTEACWVVNQQYLEKVRPDLAEKCIPKSVIEQLPANLKLTYGKMRAAARVIPQHVNAYMDKNPDVRGVFYGRGGPIWMSFHPNEERWMGPFTLDNMWHFNTPAAGFPADVWMLSEEQTMEPMPSVDRVTVTDPEGTNVAWNLTERQARNWAKGVYLRGHLFMFPQEAYGQYGLSVVNYPALDPEYIPVDDSVLINGTIAATASHAGFFPRMVETWKNGYLVDVKGGGTYGDFLRTLMKQPGIKTTVWPQRKRPGYFQFFETALATNPKIVRDDLSRNFGTGAERARDGVIHWGLGSIYWNDPGSKGGESSVTGKLAEFAKKTGLPGGHGFHMHTYFNTMKMHLRGSNKWVTTVNKGRSTSLDSPEVRALASRYGNPDEILRTAWIPEVPGINAPGSYASYAADPYRYAQSVMSQVKAGTYKQN